MSSADARSTTPPVPCPIYFSTGAQPDALCARLETRIGEHCGGAVVTSGKVEAAAVKEVGAADAVAAAAAQRLKTIDASDLVVAECSGADATVGAEVMYALHRRRIPVLCLWRSGSGGSFAESLPRS